MAGGQPILGASKQFLDAGEQALSIGHSFLLSDFQKTMFPHDSIAFLLRKFQKTIAWGTAWLAGRQFPAPANSFSALVNRFSASAIAFCSQFFKKLWFLTIP